MTNTDMTETFRLLRERGVQRKAIIAYLEKITKPLKTKDKPLPNDIISQLLLHFMGTK